MSLRGYMAAGMLSAFLLPWGAYFGLASTGEAVRVAGALAVLAAIVTFVGGQIRRNVVRPLQALVRAADAIAEGEPGDGDTPVSSVAEIANLRAGFLSMQAALAAAYEQQAAVEAERRFFLDAVAHDLRTPLFVLRGHLDGLADGVVSSPESRARYLAVCREKAAHIDRLVSDLLAASHLDTLEATLVRVPVDLTAVVARIVRGWEAEAAHRDVALTVHLGSAPCPVAADADGLERALGNLIRNALQYTPPGGSVRVRLLVEGAAAAVTVEDTGPGLETETLPHLFEPLYRASASRPSEEGGLGLGLTIARRILRAHGGDVDARNRPEGGAAFVATLPYQGPVPV